MAVDVPGGILKQTDVRETITNTEEDDVRFNLDFARFDNKIEPLAGQRGLYISPDGLNIYVCNVNDDVVQYTMSTRFDITTATITNTLDVSAKETDLYGVFFKPDGTKMYTLGDAGDSVDEYDLSTTWDISTAVYLQEFATVVNPRGLYFREDGKQMYITGATGTIQSKHLSTPWDVSTAVNLDSVAFAGPKGIYISRDGFTLFMPDAVGNVTIWKMTAPFKISTAAADSIFDIFPPLSANYIVFNPSGSRMYCSLNAANTTIHGYSIKRGWR